MGEPVCIPRSVNLTRFCAGWSGQAERKLDRVFPAVASLWMPFCRSKGCRGVRWSNGWEMGRDVGRGCWRCGPLGRPAGKGEPWSSSIRRVIFIHPRRRLGVWICKIRLWFGRRLASRVREPGRIKNLRTPDATRGSGPLTKRCVVRMSRPWLPGRNNWIAGPFEDCSWRRKPAAASACWFARPPPSANRPGRICGCWFRPPGRLR